MKLIYLLISLILLACPAFAETHYLSSFVTDEELADYVMNTSITNQSDNPVNVTLATRLDAANDNITVHNTALDPLHVAGITSGGLTNAEIRAALVSVGINQTVANANSVGLNSSSLTALENVSAYINNPTANPVKVAIVSGSGSGATQAELNESLTILSGGDPLNVVVSISSAGANTIVTPTDGKYLKIYAYDLVNPGNSSIVFSIGSTAKSGAMYGTSLSNDIAPYIWKGAVNEKFNITLGSAKSVTGYVTYVEV